RPGHLEDLVCEAEGRTSHLPNPRVTASLHPRRHARYLLYAAGRLRFPHAFEMQFDAPDVDLIPVLERAPALGPAVDPDAGTGRVVVDDEALPGEPDAEVAMSEFRRRKGKPHCD